MKRVLIWDLPTRLFHWLLSAGFFAAAYISLVLGDHSPWFPYHAIIGLTLTLMVCMRIVWGFLGSRYARFSSFVFGPRAVLQYMKGALLGGGQRFIGHNPGSAVAIFAIFVLVLGLAVTGIMLGRGNGSVKDLHEILSYVFVFVVIGHVVGVLLHTIRHRENITVSMMHGKKDAEEPAAIPSSRPVIAILFLIVVTLWAGALVRNFDREKQTTKIPLIGTELEIGD